MKAETVRRFTDAGHRKRARAYYTVQELARIATAGGGLSHNARSRLAGLHKAFPGLPKKMPVFAHLLTASYSGSGYSAETRELAQRSEALRGGQEGVRQCKTRGVPYH